MNKIFTTAIKAVSKSAYICKEIQAQLIKEDALTKEDRSPVTIADFASQAIICRTLKAEFPEIPIVGEEDANSLRQKENKILLEKIGKFLTGWTEEEILDAIDQGNGEAKGRFWTVDPIDGTKGFLRGEQYAVALALIENGQVQMGILGCPNLNRKQDESGLIAYAIKGQGAFTADMDGKNAHPVKVSQNSADELIRFLESVEAAHANHGLQGQIMDALGEKAQSVRFDSQVKYAVLAQGIAEVYLRLPNELKPDYREKIWDHAAGMIIVQEAGGRVTDMFGKNLDFTQGKKLLNNRGIMVSNGLVHDEILELINKFKK
ncbi:MAG: 3'(2'),5'-bisphosphate nucleotidase [Calditrichaceae bacterium]|nr:3'(2'),5'-bisphosphate nucleotidase [Calditrichaceae bacterium]HES60128.1 3'(2'),5'-bisphosphate nucleotidase [Caldithrix sp.]